MDHGLPAPAPEPGFATPNAPAWSERARLLQGMTWRGIALLFAVALALAAWTALGHHLFPAIHGKARLLEIADTLVFAFGHNLPVLALQFLAVVVVDNLGFRGRWRVAALMLAVASGSFAAAVFDYLVLEGEDQSVDSLFRYVLSQTVMSCAFTGPLVLAFFARRRDTEIAEALHHAELERSAAERGMLASQLRGLRARIEPGFLFDTLADARDAYVRDPAAGERMLSELIRFLRAALPPIRETLSTWEHESRLVRAWLAIVQLRGTRLAFRVEGEDGTGDAVLPPVLLTPIAEVLLPRDSDQEATLEIEARRIGGRFRVSCEGGACALKTADSTRKLAEVRAQLGALYGERATLAVESVGGVRGRIVVEIPHERIEGGPR